MRQCCRDGTSDEFPESFRCQDAQVAGEVCRSMAHQERGEFTVYVLTRPCGRNFDHTSVKLRADQRPEVVTVEGDEDASLCNSKVINRWIFEATAVEVVSKMLDVEV